MCRNLTARFSRSSAKGVALDRAAVLVDVPDGLGGNASRRFRIALQRPHAPAGPDRRRHAAVFEDAAHAAHGVGAPTEPEKVDAVAGLPDANDLGVAVDDVLGDPQAGCLAQQIVDAPKPRDLYRLALGARAEPAVVEGKLQLGVDAAVGGDAGGAKQLVDVAARLVGHVAPSLPGAVGEDQDVLAHACLPLGPVADARLQRVAGTGRVARLLREGQVARRPGSPSTSRTAHHRRPCARVA